MTGDSGGAEIAMAPVDAGYAGRTYAARTCAARDLAKGMSGVSAATIPGRRLRRLRVQSARNSGRAACDAPIFMQRAQILAHLPAGRQDQRLTVQRGCSSTHFAISG